MHEQLDIEAKALVADPTQVVAIDSRGDADALLVAYPEMLVYTFDELGDRDPDELADLVGGKAIVAVLPADAPRSLAERAYHAVGQSVKADARDGRVVTLDGWSEGRSIPVPDDFEGLPGAFVAYLWSFPDHRDRNAVPAAKREPKSDSPSTSVANGDGPGFCLKTRRLSEVQVTPLKYLVKPYIPQGVLTTIAGDGGSGKSTLALDVAAKLSRGLPPLGTRPDATPEPCDVLLVAAEDGIADTVVPRLIAAGADLDRIEVVQGITSASGTVISFDITYVDVIRDYIEAGRKNGRDYRFIVVDPLTTCIGRARVDDHRDAELKPALERLIQLAQNAGVAIWGVVHLSKASGRSATHRVLGGGAYVNSARLVYLLGTDPDGGDDGLRVLAPIKCNLPIRPPSLRVRRESVDHDEAMHLAERRAPHLDAEQRRELAEQLSRLVYEGECDISGDQIVSAQSGQKRSRAEEAAAFIRETLAGGKAMPSTEIIALGKDRGFHRDLMFKGKELVPGCRPRKDGFGCWIWALDDAESAGKPF